MIPRVTGKCFLTSSTTSRLVQPSESSSRFWTSPLPPSWPRAASQPLDRLSPRRGGSACKCSGSVGWGQARGRSWQHSPSRTAQRGWNRQPVRRDEAATAAGPGSAPGARRRCRAAAAKPSRPHVYGWCGRVEELVAPAPAPRPPPRTSRRTSSAVSATTPRSCVITMIALPNSCCETLHQVEDLRLRRHVERGRRLVGDQQVGIVDERHRDHHALAHAAGELVRVVVDAPLGARDADRLQQLDCARAAAALVETSRWS